MTPLITALILSGIREYTNTLQWMPDSVCPVEMTYTGMSNCCVQCTPHSADTGGIIIFSPDSNYA
jgi:hypothetical protein